MIVVDASIITGHILPDEDSSLASKILARYGDDPAGIIVPSIFKYELANAMRSSWLRKRIDTEESHQYITKIESYMFMVDQNGSLQSCLILSQKHNLSLYDASYLEIAVRRQIPFASHDAQLQTAIRTEGLPDF